MVARFVTSDLELDEGWYVASYRVRDASRSQYFRLRGTNLGRDVPGQTANGEPLVDDPVLTAGTNDAAKACADLWFYSNPIFVEVTRGHHRR